MPAQSRAYSLLPPSSSTATKIQSNVRLGDLRSGQERVQPIHARAFLLNPPPIYIAKLVPCVRFGYTLAGRLSGVRVLVKAFGKLSLSEKVGKVMDEREKKRKKV